MDNMITMQTWELVVLIISTVLGGGAIGIGTIGMVVYKILNSPSAIRFLENLANGVNPDTAVKLVELGKATRAVGDLAIEVFDGVPAEQKLDKPALSEVK